MAGQFSDFFGRTGARVIRPTAPDHTEIVSGGLALVLLAAVVIAVWRGQSQWSTIPWQVWVHLASISAVLAITPVMMWRRRGDRMHRVLGWVWAMLLFGSALISFDIRLTGQGRLSLIHILSVLTVIGVPVLILAARRHDIERHRSQARGFVVGALLVAGFFTFPFQRLLGSWLFG